MQDSPVRISNRNRNRAFVDTSIFGGTQNTIMEKDEGLERINERTSTYRSGKDYLRTRTLNKGCPHLIKMVEKLHQRENQQQAGKRKKPFRGTPASMSEEVWRYPD